MDVSDEIKQVERVRPHLVILGAGASRAAFPNGESSGKLLPLMEDFVDIVPIKHFLEKNGINWRGLNFEEIYSNFTTDSHMSVICSELQTTIYTYFSSLSLPSTPTLYDHLLLSLRDKDVIATFNWDPFLIQAYRRNYGKVESLPNLLFLHGNVLAAYCQRDSVLGVRGGRCSKCGRPFAPSQLLYPVTKKDYKSDLMISNQWEDLEFILKNALFVTIFGYSAPASDAAAIDILSRAWGKPEDRQFEQIEIIDIKDDKILRKNWGPFIHTHHYDTIQDFYNSWIANHPRRTVEAFYNQYIEAQFIEDHPIPKNVSFPDLWDWFVPLNEAEKHARKLF
jgi:hypothetical protein